MQGAENLRLRRVKTTRVFEEICEQIRRRVASGRLKPGDKLPAERELALEFRVSRPAVREALRSLEMSGLISLQKGVRGGAFIRPANSEALNQTLKDAVALRQLPRSKCVEAIRVIGRAIIELACDRSRLASGRIVVAPREGSRDLTGVIHLMQVAALADNELLTVLAQSLANTVEPLPNAAASVGMMRSVEKMLSAVSRGDFANAAAGWEDYLVEVFVGSGPGQQADSPAKGRR
jgi:DNA-binding transcriptional regulator YhcF (GntR family)